MSYNLGTLLNWSNFTLVDGQPARRFDIVGDSVLVTLRGDQKVIFPLELTRRVKHNCVITADIAGASHSIQCYRNNSTIRESADTVQLEDLVRSAKVIDVYSPYIGSVPFSRVQQKRIVGGNSGTVNLVLNPAVELLAEFPQGIQLDSGGCGIVKFLCEEPRKVKFWKLAPITKEDIL